MSTLSVNEIVLPSKVFAVCPFKPLTVDISHASPSAVEIETSPLLSSSYPTGQVVTTSTQFVSKSRMLGAIGKDNEFKTAYFSCAITFNDKVTLNK